MLMSDALCIVKYLIHDLPIPDLGSKVTVLTVHPILFIGALYHRHLLPGKNDNIKSPDQHFSKYSLRIINVQIY